MTLLQRLEGVLVELGGQLLDWQTSGWAVRPPPVVGQKDKISDELKNLADQRAHWFLVGALAALDPGVLVLSEEDTSRHSLERPDRYWWIDPIDGTSSWGENYEGWVTQAALMDGGEPVLTAVHAPKQRKTWLAERGAGATCNGKTIEVSGDNTRLRLVDNYNQPTGLAADANVELNCTDYRASGSIGLKACLVADGTADLCIKATDVLRPGGTPMIIRDWDIAPPWLIAQEAGATIGLPDGRPWTFTGPIEKPGFVVARSKELYDEAVAWLAGRKLSAN